MKTHPTWIALLLVAALLVVGCGGGGGDESSESTAAETTSTAAGSSGGQLTKAELIAKGDAICTEVYAVADQLDPEGSTKEALRVAALRGGMVKRLLALGVPQETEASYAEYTTAAKALIQAENEVKFAAKHGDTEALEVAEASSLSAFSFFEGSAGLWGFKECSNVNG